MTIQENLKTDNDTRWHDCQHGKHEDDDQNAPLRAFFNKVSSQRFAEGKVIQSRIPLSNNSSDLTSLSGEIINSPRSLLDDQRKMWTRTKPRSQEFNNSPRNFSSEQGLKKCSSGDEIYHSYQLVSNGEVPVSSFNIQEFFNLKLLKSSKSKSFDKRFLPALEETIGSSNIQAMDENYINKCLRAKIIRKSDDFFEEKKDPLSLNIEDVEKSCLTFAKKYYKPLCSKDSLYAPVHRNFFLLRLQIAETLKDLNNNSKNKLFCNSRSKLLSDIVEAVEFLITPTLTSPYSKKNTQDVVRSLQFYEKFINKSVKEPSVRSFLLLAVHPEKEKAQKTLQRLSFWGSDDGYCAFVSEVRNAIQIYLKQLLVQSKTTCFSENFLSSWESEKVDLSQVARSYIMNNKPIYNTLQINGQDVRVNDITETETRECQKIFFKEFFRILYEKGLMSREDVSGKVIELQTEKLLDEKEFVGQEILVAGSNNAWHVCDTKLRAMYPPLFNEVYKTRAKQGIDCFIEVSSEKKYSIQVNKTYTTYPRAIGSSSTESWAIDYERSLCTIKVTWQVDYDSDKGWSHTVSTPILERKKATDEEWEELLNILLAPRFPEKKTLPDNPENKTLKSTTEFFE